MHAIGKKNIMKKILIQVLSFITVKYWSKLKGIYIHDSVIIFGHFSNSSASNQIDIRHSILKRTSIEVNGNNNKINLQGPFSATKIKVIGNNNQINIQKINGITLSEIIIRGEECSISIGNNSGFGNYLKLICMGKLNSISIGEDCMLADHVELWNTNSHPIYNDQGEIINPSRPIIIGNHVWIGKDSRVTKGVNIGNNAIIGFNSLVTKNIKSNTLNAGSPTRQIREGVNWDQRFITI